MCFRDTREQKCVRQQVTDATKFVRNSRDAADVKPACVCVCVLM